MLVEIIIKTTPDCYHCQSETYIVSNDEFEITDYPTGYPIACLNKNCNHVFMPDSFSSEDWKNLKMPITIDQEQKDKIGVSILNLDPNKRYNLEAIANHCKCQDFELLLYVLYYFTVENKLNVSFYVNLSSDFEIGPFDDICKIPDKMFNLQNQEITLFPENIQAYYQIK